jgi:hypothetical protein
LNQSSKNQFSKKSSRIPKNTPKTFTPRTTLHKYATAHKNRATRINTIVNNRALPLTPSCILTSAFANKRRNGGTFPPGAFRVGLFTNAGVP